MNRMCFDELLFKLAIDEDLVGADVHSRLRVLQRTDDSIREFIKPVQQGQRMVSVSDRVDDLRGAWLTATPVERSVIRLASAESGLRGRLADAILHLELTAPGDVRDAMTAAQAAASNNHPGALRDALDFLAAAGHDAAALAGLEAEREALYPTDPDDIEPAKEVPHVAVQE